MDRGSMGGSTQASAMESPPLLLGRGIFRGCETSPVACGNAMPGGGRTIAGAAGAALDEADIGCPETGMVENEIFKLSALNTGGSRPRQTKNHKKRAPHPNSTRAKKARVL